MVGKTDVGRQRSRNEDSFLLLKECALGAIADGMGGHIDGHIASQTAVDTIKEIYQARYPHLLSQKFANLEELIQAQKILMIDAIEQANTNIFVKNRSNFGFEGMPPNAIQIEGMGTTVVAVQIGEGYALTAWVGDSRIYLLHNSKLTQVSQDHSLVGELIRYNIIDKKDRMFFQKNIITRALGMAEKVVVDLLLQQVSPGDIFLMCSDGLSDLVSDEQMERIITQNHEDLNQAVEKLISEANNNGGLDNISANLVLCKD